MNDIQVRCSLIVLNHDGEQVIEANLVTTRPSTGSASANTRVVPPLKVPISNALLTPLPETSGPETPIVPVGDGRDVSLKGGGPAHHGELDGRKRLEQARSE